MSDIRYDVLAVSLGEKPLIRILASDKDAKNAEAIIGMAVARRGVDSEFYTTALTGTYAEGDEWSGS